MVARLLAAPAATLAPVAATGDRRRRILEAAARLFMAEGYGATSMDRVARAAGVSKATLYAHFRAKEQLFTTIVAEECARHGAAEAAVLAPAGLAQALRAMGQAYLTLLFSDNAIALYRVVMAEAHRFPELGHAFFEAGPRGIFARFAAWATARQQEAKLRPDAEPGTMAEHFFALLRTSFFLRRLMGLEPAPDAAAIGRVVDAAVHVFMRAYASVDQDG
jgi:TetR/AcrR family transcriptional regulator, mexJK operon transcriptional repressor